MQLLNFPLDSIEENLPAILLDTGVWLFSAQETCIFGELATRVNASKWVRNNIPAKWIVELKTKEGGGRPGLYLTKPGFYFAICQGQSEMAIKFRDEVFENILPKIDASGGYIMPSATSKQIEALKAELQELQESNKLLEASTKIAEENSQQALQVTQKILRYFLALNRVAWNLYVDLRLIDPIARKENKTKSDWERIDRAYRNSGGTALCFLRRWRENIEESSNFLCTYSEVVDSDSSLSFITNFWNHLVKQEAKRNL